MTLEVIVVMLAFMFPRLASWVGRADETPKPEGIEPPE